MKNKPRIIILLPCWKRPEIVQLTVRQLDIFINKNKKDYDITVLFVISFSDPYLSNLEKIIEEFKGNKIKVFAENKPLGEKMNKGVKAAISNGFDYLMNLGSDDLIHPNIMKYYAEHIRKGEHVFGFNKLYFYELNEDKSFLFSYKKNELVGACRMISKEAVLRTYLQFGFLYEPHRQRAMDSSSAALLNKKGYKFKVIDTEHVPLIVDIKNGNNINSYNLVRNSGDMNIIIDSNPLLIKEVFPILKEFLQTQKSNL